MEFTPTKSVPQPEPKVEPFVVLNHSHRGCSSGPAPVVVASPSPSPPTSSNYFSLLTNSAVEMRTFMNTSIPVLTQHLKADNDLPDALLLFNTIRNLKMLTVSVKALSSLAISDTFKKGGIDNEIETAKAVENINEFIKVFESHLYRLEKIAVRSCSGPAGCCSPISI